MDRRPGPGEHSLQGSSTLELRRAAEIAAIGGQKIEPDESRRNLRRQFRDARRGRMQAHLQRVEVEGVASRDDDLAVDDGPGRQLRDRGLVKLGKISIERPQVPALDEDVRGAAKDDGAKAVPLGLVEKVARRDLVGKFREHRLDRGLDREGIWHTALFAGTVQGSWFRVPGSGSVVQVQGSATSNRNQNAEPEP